MLRNRKVKENYNSSFSLTFKQNENSTTLTEKGKEVDDTFIFVGKMKINNNLFHANCNHHYMIS